MSRDIKKDFKDFYTNRNWVIFWLFAMYPFGVYLMWKGKHFNPDLRWMISFLWLIIMWLIPKNEIKKEEINDCSTPLYANQCTYYRDENCKVTSQTCEE